MAELEITTMSSKGQIVIPVEMRKDFREGEKFVVIKVGKRIILKSVEEFDENIEEDLEFSRRTEEAWQRYEKGEFVGPLTAEEFKKRMESW
ncbi:MAG: AbrB/MazE/SpoVT family DNA-binding domain-containing protein [Nanoarchaeota archaeon]